MAAIKRIDCHSHYFASLFGERLLQQLAGRGSTFQREVAARPAWRDLVVHAEVMKRTGVDIAVIIEHGSLLESLRRLGGSLNKTIEAYNESMSNDVARFGGQFLAAAVVDPFGDKEAIEGLKRSLSLPFIVAIGLVASYEGTALDDPVFEPIFDVARDRDVPVMVHPSTVAESWTQTLRLDDQFLRSGVGFFLDNGLCILRMALQGTFDKYPDVRFMFCQLGGVAPFFCGRWDLNRRRYLRPKQEPAEPPLWTRKTLGEYLGRIWLDAHTQDRHALSLVLAEAGEHVIVLGGDHPYTIPENGILYTMAEIDALGVADEIRRKIESENALRLLGARFRQAAGPG
jgi:predicted TIM-barrel fold metal-dependent hydrolase